MRSKNSLSKCDSFIRTLINKVASIHRMSAVRAKEVVGRFDSIAFRFQHLLFWSKGKSEKR